MNHFLRAGVEGICFALNHILKILETASGTITQLNVSGGFLNSATWIKILADITGKKICLSETKDASSIGAALMAMKATKMIDSYSGLATRNEVGIPPDEKTHVVYEKYFRVYKKIYDPLKDSMHEVRNITF